MIAAALIVGGCIGIVVGFVGKEFYVGDADAISSFDRKSSTWSGRLVAILAGGVLLVGGIKLMFWG
jgi:hypothetical protein